uniref:Uncharacterized protein n=1 Tax=Arundo donax TaxID=35708 RepID=A0A0A9G914_ARUDO
MWVQGRSRPLVRLSYGFSEREPSKRS